MSEAGQNSPRTDLVSKDKALPGVTPERWQKIKELFLAASERSPNDRAEFLNQSCGSDQSLRSEVESMLAAEHHAAGSTFLDIAVTHDRLLGRRVGAYQIVERIASGGMAAVYLAVRADDQYQKQVAVKVVHPQSASDELLNRFRTERQTLAGLDHPNIVKLLDGGSTGEGLPYLVMDYVEGTPIDEYCDAGKLSIEGRLRLFCQVCAPVHYAHQHLVVHRDLKPSNILVTPDGAPKLLDFGIAKVFDPHVPAQTLVVTQTATRRMTPAYASPEQVRGQAVSGATDIYSLGVILYELLTGHRPYKLKQCTPAEMEKAICEEEPEKLSTAVDRIETITTDDGAKSTSITPELVSQTREGEPDKLRRRLRGDLDNIVLKALQKEPKRRYASVKQLADDLQRHLDHLPVLARPSTLSYRASKFVSRHKTEVVAAALLLFVLAGGISFTFWEARRAKERAEANIENQHSQGRPSVAVLGFKNLSGLPETAWLSPALSEMLTTELAAGGQLRTAPGENVANMKINLTLPDADALSRETLHRVRKNLNSDFVVLGSYLDQGESGGRQIRLDLRLQDAVTGETLAAAADSGTEANLADLVSRAGAALRRKLGAGDVSPADSAGLKASMPSNTDATRLYAEGLARLRVFDAMDARDLLKKAIAAAPNFALAHAALADTWRTMGRDPEAKEEAKIALGLRGNLPREKILLIEGNFRQSAREWDKAIEIYKTLFNFFPDNLEYGLLLAGVQTSAGKGQDALSTLDALRKLPPPQGNDPRVDLAEGLAANSITDYKRQAAAASIAAKKAQAMGARLVIARSLPLEARAMMEMGEPAKALPLLEQAREICLATGDRFVLARVLQNIGLAYYYQSDFVKAKETYEQALAIQEEVGNRANQAKLWNGIAMVLDRQNDLDGAKQAYQRTLEICRAIDDRPMTGTAIGNIGMVEAQQGDYKSAQKHFQESLDIARQVGERSAIALQLGNLAQMMALEGNLSGAKPMLMESIQISRESGKRIDLGLALSQLGDVHLQLGELAAAQDRYAEARQVFASAGNKADANQALSNLGHVQAVRGGLVEARKSFEEALAAGESMGNTRDMQDARLALAEIAMQQGRLSDGESYARQALEAFRAGKDKVNEANAEAALAEVLLTENKLPEAQATIEEARKLAAETSDTDVTIYVGLVRARIAASSGKYAEATNSLRQIQANARKAKLIERQFDSQLALGETDIKAGNLVAGRAELRSLEREARRKGYLLVAEQAAEAAKSTQRDQPVSQ